VPFAIRPATAADVPDMQALGQVVWPVTYEHFAGADHVAANLAAWWTAEALTASLAESAAVLVAVDGARVVGLVEVGEYDGDPVMWKLYVHPDRHGEGIGSALLAAALAALPAESAPLRTEYTAGNEPAGRWYAARGFVETSREGTPGVLQTVWLQLLGPVPPA